MTPLAIRHQVHALRSEGWTQSHITEVCGISLRTVQVLIQRGAHDPQRQTIIAALGQDQIFAPVTFSRALDTERFIEWLTQLKPHLTENQVLILDNLRVHPARAIKECLQENPMRLVFLTPYSPHFNPIEGLWALLKARLRKMRIRGFDQLNDQPPRLLKEIEQQHGNALIRMCGYTPTSTL